MLSLSHSQLGTDFAVYASLAATHAIRPCFSVLVSEDGRAGMDSASFLGIEKGIKHLGCSVCAAAGNHANNNTCGSGLLGLGLFLVQGRPSNCGGHKIRKVAWGLQDLTAVDGKYKWAASANIASISSPVIMIRELSDSP